MNADGDVRGGAPPYAVQGIVFGTWSSIIHFLTLSYRRDFAGAGTRLSRGALDGCTASRR